MLGRGSPPSPYMVRTRWWGGGVGGPPLPGRGFVTSVRAVRLRGRDDPGQPPDRPLRTTLLGRPPRTGHTEMSAWARRRRGGGRGSRGPPWRTPLRTRPCPAQNSPVSSFPISPAPPPCAPPLATDHCLWRAAGGQGRVRSARGGHTVRGLSVGWRRRFASSAGRQVRSGELRCRRAAASGGTTAGASGVDCRRWTIAGMAGICLRQGRGSSGGLVGRGGRQPQGGGWGWGRQDSHNCKGNGHNVDGRNGDGHGLDRDGHGCNLVRCSRNGEGEGSDGSGSDGNDCDGNGGRSGANQGESGHGGDIQPPPECCGRPR